MGSIFTALVAKVMTILRCAELILVQSMTMRRIHICSDSKATIVAFTKLLPTQSDLEMHASTRKTN
jgi:hypothetical protein